MSGRYQTARGRVWRIGPLPVLSIVARASSRFFSDRRVGRFLPIYSFRPGFPGSGTLLPLQGHNRSAEPRGNDPHQRISSETQRFGTCGRQIRPARLDTIKATLWKRQWANCSPPPNQCAGSTSSGQKYLGGGAIGGGGRAPNRKAYR